MYNEKDYCNNCKWLEDRSEPKFPNSGRCGLYGDGLEYTSCGYKRCEKCKSKDDREELPIATKDNNEKERVRVALERLANSVNALNAELNTFTDNFHKWLLALGKHQDYHNLHFN